MFRITSLALLLASTSALAAEVPIDDIVARQNVQIGQLYVTLGQAQMEISKLRKELDDAKQKSKASTDDGSSRTQSQIRKEDGDPEKGGKGIQSSGQGIGPAQ